MFHLDVKLTRDVCESHGAVFSQRLAKPLTCLYTDPHSEESTRLCVLICFGFTVESEANVARSEVIMDICVGEFFEPC